MNAARLDRRDITEAIEAAKASSARYARDAGYYANTLLSHLVGRVGELAGERWFVSMGFPVVANWRYADRERLCDLEVATCRIEVKTWSVRFWQEFGRSVAVQQLPSVAKKAGVILWETVESPWSTIEAWQRAEFATVAFRGFSTVRDVRAAPRRMTTSRACTVENYQLDDVRELGRLLDALHRHCGRVVRAPTAEEIFK